MSVEACGSAGAGGAPLVAAPGDAGTVAPSQDGGSAPSFGEGGYVGPTGNSDGAAGSVLSNVQIVPANASLTVNAGQTATLGYKVMGVVNGSGSPVDVTSHFVFWVPDNYLVGDFPTSGTPTFTTRLPATPTDPPQQGGALTVEAEALNPGNQAVTVTTSLTVQLVAQLDYTGGGNDGGAGGDGGPTVGGAPDDAGAIPTSPGSLFNGPADQTRAPTLEYPNNGTMLPPNLKLLDVHWMPGSTKNTLFQITFASAAASITYYTRCDTLGGLLVPGACGFQLDPTGYAYLAQSNAGQGNVALTIKGTDDAGTGVGTSATFNIQFAQESVNGGVYYWDVTDTQIMRFDFGGTSTTPEVFLKPSEYGTNGTCIGCHALSRDGTKMAASAGGQGNGYLVYVNDIATIGAPLAATDDGVNRIQFASFDPLGDQFVAVYGDGAPGQNSALTPNNLFFHDGTTGVIIPSETKALTFQPDHPSWSPDGTMIAMTHVGVANTSQREYLGGIDVATFAAASVDDGGVTVGDGGSSLGDPVVVIPSMVVGATDATNSYNPSFSPDSTFLLFSQTICPVANDQDESCDSDVANNNAATTWAVKPAAGATPLHLDNAGAPGVADGTSATQMIDTFPRATPFETKQGSGRLFWFTVASLRQPGLRVKDYDGNSRQQQLWMFAVDPDKLLAGQDGSFTAFFLPFQDPTTSNHIAQWTEQIVSQNPAPPVPPPPPPPPPPAPPPPQ